MALFFRSWDEFPSLERTAIDMCAGRILDIGAGAGCHSLILQDRRLDVFAIDVLPACVEVMRRRGVRQAQCVDVNTFQTESFDTLLCLMNGLALARNLPGLEPFLKNIRRLIKPGGQFLVDSTDRRQRARHPAGQGADAEPRYPGEARLQLEYASRKGPSFTQLYVDPDTLAVCAGNAGWTCKVVEAGEGNRYLARLMPA